jgi:hypothetical protein
MLTVVGNRTEMSNPKEKKYDFEVNSAPIAWLDYAEELKEIAELTIKHSGTTINRYPDTYKTLSLERGFFLNYGYSLETILKGLLIAENPEFVAEGKISEDISKGHSLARLTVLVKSLSFEGEELKLLNVLSEAIPYWGRYPIPKKYSQVSEKVSFSESIHKELEALWFKIGRCLYETIKFGWTGPSGVKTCVYLSSTFESEAEMKASVEKFNKMHANGESVFGNVDQ